MSRRTAVAALTLVTSGVLGSSAQANITTVDRSGTQMTVKVSNEGNDLRPRNTINVTEDASATYVEDTGVDTTAVVPAGSCFQITARKIGCPADPNNQTRLTVTPGNDDDSVAINLPARSASGISTIFVHGGAGKDVITGSEGPDTLEGDGLDGLGNPLGTSAAFTGFNDVLLGRGGSDTLRGGQGRDYLNGGSAATGADQANTLDGGAESDFFDLGTALGPDRVVGGANEGRTGANSLSVGSTTYLVIAGDTASYESRAFSAAGTTGVTVDLDSSPDDGGTGLGEGDQVDPDVEGLIGSVRDDRLVGTGNVERIEGGLGSDSLATAGGADELRFREGVRDKCYTLTSGATVDLDLTDPTPSDCQISIFPTTTKIAISPKDETMPPPVIGSALRRAGGALNATVRCARTAPKACSGVLSLQPARGGKRLARTKFRVPAGKSRGVALRTPARLKTARLTTVGRGVSRRGSTTVLAIRRVR